MTIHEIEKNLMEQAQNVAENWPTGGFLRR
jgi:hypothetical protein